MARYEEGPITGASEAALGFNSAYVEAESTLTLARHDQLLLLCLLHALCTKVLFLFVRLGLRL